MEEVQQVEVVGLEDALYEAMPNVDLKDLTRCLDNGIHAIVCQLSDINTSLQELIQMQRGNLDL